MARAFRELPVSYFGHSKILRISNNARTIREMPELNFVAILKWTVISHISQTKIVNKLKFEYLGCLSCFKEKGWNS